MLFRPRAYVGWSGGTILHLNPGGFSLLFHVTCAARCSTTLVTSHPPLRGSLGHVPQLRRLPARLKRFALTHSTELFSSEDDPRRVLTFYSNTSATFTDRNDVPRFCRVITLNPINYITSALCWKHWLAWKYWRLLHV